MLIRKIIRGDFGAPYTVWEATSAADVVPAKFAPDPGDILLRYDTGTTYMAMEGGGLRIIGAGGPTVPTTTKPTDGTWTSKVGATGYILSGFQSVAVGGGQPIGPAIDLVSLPPGVSYAVTSPNAAALCQVVPAASDVTAADPQSPDATKRGECGWYGNYLTSTLIVALTFAYGFNGTISTYCAKSSGPTWTYLGAPGNAITSVGDGTASPAPDANGWVQFVGEGVKEGATLTLTIAAASGRPIIYGIWFD